MIDDWTTQNPIVQSTINNNQSTGQSTIINPGCFPVPRDEVLTSQKRLL
jgi:hypothetical protein